MADMDTYDEDQRGYQGNYSTFSRMTTVNNYFDGYDGYSEMRSCAYNITISVI